ncbi:MAG TPA: 2-dehydropantoate 2-reductase [Acidimicrobiales bacterium]|nr:2-dehydropantoate 2-reductase [Acidimicrobiales bacterium]
MRALVAGVGAVGGWLLARLTEGGADVTGWARGDTYRRLASGEPLTLVSRDGDWSGPVRVVDDPAAAGAVELVLVCTKSTATEEISAMLPVGPTVVSVQNGIDNAELLARRHARVIPTVVRVGCRRVDAVNVRHTSSGWLITDDDGLATWLREHGVRVEQVTDIAVEQWTKLAANVANNSLTALLDCPTGALLAHPSTVALIDRMLAEVAAVAAASGVAADIAGRVRAVLATLPYDNSTSMRDDRHAGRAFEVDALTGAVLRRAELLRLDVPTVAAVDALIRWLSDAVSQPRRG